MEILDTLRFANEKLDIKPMTRSRLAAIQRNPKPILETGDVVKVLTYIRPNDTKSYQLWTYVSYDDFKNYDYNTKLNLYHLKDDAEFKEGAFVFPMVGHGLHIMTVSIFDDNLYYRTQIAGKEVVRQITAIYRGEKKQQPLDSNYFENPTDAGKRCVWKKRNNDVIAEKLDIKPMTKSRLDAEKSALQRKPKLLLKSGDVLVSEYAGNTRRYQIFVAEKDFKEWKVPMPPTEQDWSQGLFLCKNIIYDILAFPVSKYDDNLNLKKSTFIEKAVAIYRNRDIINPPITSNLLIMLVDNIDNLRCVWKADGASINEKLVIKPVTKDMLSDYKKPSVDGKTKQFIENNNLIWNPVTKSYDCEGDVRVSEDIVIDGKIKIRFGKVDGDFYCNHINLTSLEGVPNEVCGDFHCGNNNLTTLEGAPQEVGRDFNCSDNNLTTLEGAPKKVNGSFYCNYNELNTLEGVPNVVGKSFDCQHNNLTTLEGLPKKICGYFDCDNNNLTTLEGAPKEVGGSFYCNYNELNTLEGAPNKVGRDFGCYNNKLTTLEGAPQEVGGNFDCSNNPNLVLPEDKPSWLKGKIIR